MVRAALYDKDASVLLIGMRGAGKTTLGLIAATSLRRFFIDADSAFQKLHGSISAFVSTRGWEAFRDEETAILEKLVKEHPKGCVIACGGGVVERAENRRLLEQFKKDGGPIVHVVRDKQETIRYLVDETVRPDWGEEIRSVWSRREPYFESLCTHTIVSVTAYPPPASPQFMMKHVETAFVRLLRSIFGLASSHVSLLPGPRASPVTGPSSGEYGGYGACESEMGRGAKGARTNFVALNFPDLRFVSRETIRKVAGGVDVLELRVDTLQPSVPDTPPESRQSSPKLLPDVTDKMVDDLPSLQFVALCFGHLRRCSPLPVLYTVRTVSQGGAFPDPYEDPALLERYIALVELGFKLGAEYVDLELTLPDKHLKHLLSLRGAATQCLASDHDRTGSWNWGSKIVLDKFNRAGSLCFDLVKLVSFPSRFSANTELLQFRETVSTLRFGKHDEPLPLLAINLGKMGQLSRFLNPVFTPVTHPLLPGVAAPGQLTYAQTQQALYLSGLILEKTFFVPSAIVADTFSREAHSLGLPYTFIVEDRLPMREVERDFGGAFLGLRALPTDSASPSDILLPPAMKSGYADLVVPAYTEPDSYDTPPTPLDYYKQTNVRVLAIAEIITHNLSPINAVGISTSALLVGLNKKDQQEVEEALSIVGARWICLFACEGAEPEDAFLSTSVVPKVGAAQPTSRPQTPSRSHTPSIPYPLHPPMNTSVLSSFASPLLYSRRPPTIIISSDGAPSFPDSLFASPTGGCALDLSRGRGRLSEAIRDRPGGLHREGWQLLGPHDLQSEVLKQAFRALTGRRIG